MKYLLLVIFPFTITACNSGVESRYADPSVEQRNQKVHISWAASTIDMGRLATNMTYEVQFQYTNTGTEPLILKKVESTCGCTVIENPSQEPVLPNAKGTIKAQLDTKQLEGIILKKIYVLSNAYKPFTVLRIKAEVIPGDS